MTVRIRAVNEDLWIAHVRPRDYPNLPHPTFPHRYYAGHINAAQFHEIEAWLRANAVGEVIHNFDLDVVTRRAEKGDDDRWYTMFAFKDARTAFAFKLRWSQRWVRE